MALARQLGTASSKQCGRCTPAGAGESYEESATREIEEEMGISGVTLTKCFEFFYRDKMAQHFGGVFSCRYDGPLRLDPQEVESAEWWSLQVSPS